MLDKKYLIDIFDILGIDVEKDIIQISRDKMDSKIKTKVFGLEINLNDILKEFKKYKIKSKSVEGCVQYQPISEYPSSTRDLSFSIENHLMVKKVIKKLESIDIINLRESYMFDFYENTKTNIIKIGYRFIFQSHDRTLTDQEIDSQINIIINSILSIDSVSLPGMQ